MEAERRSALFEAARSGDQVALKREIDGMNGDDRISKLSEALCEATEAAQMEAFPVLLEAGADPCAPSQAHENKTPLYLAAELGMTDAVSSLVKGGARLDHVASNGWTCILIAAQNGHEETVKELRLQGADINALTPDDRTALHLASANGHAGVCKMLLQYGINADKVSGQGVPALSLAIVAEHKEIALLLARHKVSLSNVDSEHAKQLLRWQAQEVVRMDRIIQEKDREAERLIQSIPERCAHAASVAGTTAASNNNKVPRTQ